MSVSTTTTHGTELIFVPGQAMPSRELLAVLGCFRFSAHMLETIDLHPPGWVCSPDPIERFQGSDFVWMEHPAGYRIGYRIPPRTGTVSEELEPAYPAGSEVAF